jgi:hypothetical protein|tara:strand:+ start:990 stop:2072 length:1083 start_codon:yes stop_codon:yes gene_type:complete
MSWIKNFSLFVISLLSAVLVAELVLSYLKPVTIRNDPKWVADGYTRGHFKPNQKIIGTVGHNALSPYPRIETAKYSLNKYGYRGKDWDINYPYNIVFIGGSSTFNFHDNDDKAWPFVASNCLNEVSSTNYQNLNFSHPGYSIFDAPHLLLQKGAYFKIDWLITYHLWNDIKFIKAFAKNPDFLFNRQPEVSTTSLKSIILDLGIFPNLLGNMNLVYKRYLKSNQESFYENDIGKEISREDIESTIALIKSNYLALIKLSPPSRNFLFVKQGLLLDKDNDSFDSEIAFHYIGLTKRQFLLAQDKYYSMLDEIASGYPNVHVFNADEIIPKDLEMYEDHVHLNAKAQSILGKSICKHLLKIK